MLRLNASRITGEVVEEVAEVIVKAKAEEHKDLETVKVLIPYLENILEEKKVRGEVESLERSILSM